MSNATFKNNLSYIVAVRFIGGGDYRPVASHRQTLSHNVLSSTPRLSGVRNDNISDATN